jgi:hypothetical protein
MRPHPSEQQFKVQPQGQIISKRIFNRKAAAVSPLKQRTEEVLRGDRRAIRDPFADQQAIFLLD